MKKIVIMVQPFTVEQNVIVYEDGNKIDAFTVANVDALVPQLINYTENHTDIEELVFIGARHYNKIYGNKFQENELAKYGANKIQIRYI